MNHQTGIFLFSLMLLFSACSSGDDYDSFIMEDADQYNSQIFNAIGENEAWAQTPHLIVGKLFGPAYRTEGKSGFSVEQTEVTDDRVRIIVTQEGLLDDAVHGEKRIIEFKYQANRWIIDNIRVGFKCQSGRGQQHYTGALCH